MIISNSRIAAASCILPVSHNTDIPKSLGLRHRSALGLSQETDAIAIIVSEETGNISVAHNGKFQLALSAKDLEGILSKE
jgi:DNA integrity scanning protein DisA with diadenylate cyclase activity